MKARKQLLAAGSTVTLVAGGVFLSAAPASAVHDSPECVTAQGQFTAALHNAGVTADLEIELAVALQNLIDAEETLALLDVEGALTLAEVEELIVALLADLNVDVPNLPNINALANAEASADSAVGDARALLDVAVDGSLDQATLDALAAAGVDAETFLLAALLDEASLSAAVDAAIASGLPAGVTQADIDALRADIAADVELSADSLATVAALGVDVTLYEIAQYDLAAIAAALDAVVTVSEKDAALALIAALQTGDMAAILEAEAALEALVGESVDLSALVTLQTQLVEAQVRAQAEADVAAAIAVVEGLLMQLEGLDLDLVELEALFEAAIEACTGAAVGGGVGGGGDGDGTGDGADGGNGNAGGGTTGGTTGGNTGGTTGGTNRGMNVQTAVPTASTDPAGIGALAAGLGFMVVAGTLAARRVRNS